LQAMSISPPARNLRAGSFGLDTSDKPRSGFAD
jgi:hypothetical protein